MKRELKITLSPDEVSKLLVKVVAERQKLGDGYACHCTMNAAGELAIVFNWPLEGP